MDAALRIAGSERLGFRILQGGGQTATSQIAEIAAAPELRDLACLLLLQPRGFVGNRRSLMSDVLFIGLTLVFFALSWGYVQGCARL
jgi:hypothetical protein